MKRDYLPWLIIFGIAAAWIYSKYLNTAPPSSSLDATSQRGVFGTDTGLYGAAVADGTTSA